MRVYRLEFKENRHFGPFNPPPTIEDMIFGKSLEIPPADAAQVEASVEGIDGPYQMPGINKDVGSDNFSSLAQFVMKQGGRESVVFGFSSLDQYREWFRSPNVRRALFLNIYKNKKAGVRPKYNDLELRCFEISDKDVFVAPHQVVFNLEAATSSEAIPVEEAIK